MYVVDNKQINNKSSFETLKSLKSFFPSNFIFIIDGIGNFNIYNQQIMTVTSVINSFCFFFIFSSVISLKNKRDMFTPVFKIR